MTAYVNSRWVSASVAGWNSDATGPNTNYYGFNFDGVYVSGSVLTAESYLGPIVGSNTVGGEFSIENLPATEVNGSAISLTNRDHATYRRFSVPFQGGFDGFRPNRQIALGGEITATNTQGFNLNGAAASGSVEYKRALNQLSNADAVDFNLLVVPGVIYSQHTNVAQTAIDICESLDHNNISYLEIGTFAGGSASLVSTNSKVKNVYSIDLGSPINKEIPIRNVNKFNHIEWVNIFYSRC